MTGPGSEIPLSSTRTALGRGLDANSPILALARSSWIVQQTQPGKALVQPRLAQDQPHRLGRDHRRGVEARALAVAALAETCPDALDMRPRRNRTLFREHGFVPAIRKRSA